MWRFGRLLEYNEVGHTTLVTLRRAWLGQLSNIVYVIDNRLSRL